jgi:hypothetical protein
LPVIHRPKQIGVAFVRCDVIHHGCCCQHASRCACHACRMVGKVGCPGLLPSAAIATLCRAASLLVMALALDDLVLFASAAAVYQDTATRVSAWSRCCIRHKKTRLQQSGLSLDALAQAQY